MFLTPTSNVLKFTKSVRHENDIYRQYLDEHIVKTDNDNDMLSLADIYASFVSWFRNTHPGKAIVTSIEFGRKLRETYPVKKIRVDKNACAGVKCVKFITDDD